MTDPRRLLEAPDTTPFERDLLESWSAEQPSEAARTRALGIVGAAVVTSAAVGTAAAASSVVPKVALGLRVGLSAFAKWAIVGTIVVGGTVATVAVMRPANPPNVDAKASASASAHTKANATANASASAPTITPDDLPSVAPLESHRAPAASAQQDSLADEIALFDRAHAALEAGNAPTALALLDEYESRFRTGAFAQEAEVLRVQALVRVGDRAEATRVGDRFLAAHPTSPHAARVRAILDASKP
jgi:hypothetical protein